MNPRLRFAGAVVASAAALALGVAAAWPIYRTPWLWLVAGVALLLGVGLAWLRERQRLNVVVLVGAVLVAFAVTVVPVAAPQALTSGFLGGLVDGLAAIVLGWKQLLTLSLPVGTYQTVLVPAYLVMLLSVLLTVLLAARRDRIAVLAAIPMLAPVAFGTVFGASSVSSPLRLGPLTVAAPRELALWLAVAALGAVWVAWISGAARRAALRLGRTEDELPVARGRLARAAVAAGTVVVALLAGLLLAPTLDAGARAVPRDRIDPEIVVRERPSPLATYRVSKTDDRLDTPLFEVSADDGLPQRLRLAVLDAYDGVDFHISPDAAGRFTRFPSGDPLREPSEVSVRVSEGYDDIWAPTAGLGAPPRFDGERAADLADAFYVNRETGAAIAVPGGRGLRSGDEYSAPMETAASPQPAQNPANRGPLIDLEQMPEMEHWIEAQAVASDGTGLVELLQRLRDRGYLSHSIDDGEGRRLWLDRLAESYGTRFESSAGGHSIARVELLFEQLNAQQSAAGEKAKPDMLIAGIGDDEQFAAAGALLARALGFDSRVVVGVRLGGEDAGVPGVPACSSECTGQNLAAWIEVRGDDGAWAPIDVTPQVSKAPQRLEEGEQLPEFPSQPEERDAREVDPPVGLGEQNQSTEDPEDPSAVAWLWPVLRAVGLSLAALVLLLLPFLFLPVAKRARAKRRRNEAEPELRALGAWEEMLDRARDTGTEIPERCSRGEIGAMLGTRPAIWAAEEVDRAVFSPVGIGDAEADTVWAAADADSAERRADLGFWGRVRAAYSLKSYGIRFGRGSRRMTGDEKKGEGWGP